MFWKKKTKTPLIQALRETLFGDLPMEKWTNMSSSEEPWKSFNMAAQHVVEGQVHSAIDRLKGITEMVDIESRHYIQAYHLLKQLGHTNSLSVELFGVVIEVSTRRNDYDLLAVYSDLSARHYNYMGAGIVWENPDDSLHFDLKAVLECAKEALSNIGPWEGARPGPVKGSMVRLNILTSNGLHFGQAPMSVMDNDPIGGALLNASIILMRKLAEKAGDN